MSARVTIVMPVYNGGAYFAEALASALGQDYANVEIVIVDDGSTDDTARIVHSFRDMHRERIKYIRQENGGVAAALNTALAHATGDFFCWLSHDDLYYADKTSRQIAYHRRLGVPDACLYSGFDFIDQDSKLIRTEECDPERLSRKPALAVYKIGINGCTVMIPMRVIRRHGPFDTALRCTQDYDMWARIMEDHDFFLQPERLVKYRLHAGQGTLRDDFKVEGDRLWLRLLENVGEVGRAQLYGSTRRYYREMATFLSRGTPYQRAADFAYERARAPLSSVTVSVILWMGDDAEASLRSLDSVLRQNHRNLDVLLVATHWSETAQKAHGLTGGDGRAKFIVAQEDFAGLMNRALDAARGDYVTFLMAGDVFMPDKITNQLQSMAEGGAQVSQTSYFAVWRDVSPKRLVIPVGRPTVSANGPDARVFNAAASTLMIHKAVIARGWRFPSETDFPSSMFLADLAAVEDWHGVAEPLTEIVLSADSPQISPVRRNALAQSLRRHIDEKVGVT